jgi:hypothetical protein
VRVPSKATIRAELAHSEKIVSALADQNLALVKLVRCLSREVDRLQGERDVLHDELRAAVGPGPHFMLDD